MIDIGAMSEDLTDEEFARVEEEYSRLMRRSGPPPFSPEKDRFNTLSNLVLYRWLKADMDEGR